MVTVFLRREGQPRTRTKSHGEENTNKAEFAKWADPSRNYFESAKLLVRINDLNFIIHTI